MNERPILFSGEMVRAILAGRKTQTRRVIKPAGRVALIEEIFRVNGEFSFDLLDYEVISPYGDPGDQLWVRENIVTGKEFPCKKETYDGTYCEPMAICYQADDPNGHWNNELNKVIPSIHMPRWACRITLEVVNVRVERVQEISEADAEKEGVVPAQGMLFPYAFSFVNLWNSINAKRGYGWDVNPWVWVVEFKKVAA